MGGRIVGSQCSARWGSHEFNRHSLELFLRQSDTFNGAIKIGIFKTSPPFSHQMFKLIKITKLQTKLPFWCGYLSLDITKLIYSLRKGWHSVKDVSSMALSSEESLRSRSLLRMKKGLWRQALCKILHLKIAERCFLNKQWSNSGLAFKMC